MTIHSKKELAKGIQASLDVVHGVDGLVIHHRWLVLGRVMDLSVVHVGAILLVYLFASLPQSHPCDAAHTPRS